MAARSRSSRSSRRSHPRRNARPGATKRARESREATAAATAPAAHAQQGAQPQSGAARTQTPEAQAAQAPQHHLAPLLTSEGWALLQSLPPYDSETALQQSERLRAAGYSPELVSAALSQQRLRGRARSKFGEFADRMLFTPDGLEQSTRLSIAALHAQRLLTAGVRTVADLGCGIGGESLACAALGLEVIAVERDEATAAIATINLLPFEQARVIHGDAFSQPWFMRSADADASPSSRAEDAAQAGEPLIIDAAMLDPARRRNGSRLSDPEQWEPSWSQVMQLRERIPAMGIKVAPGIDHALLPSDSHVQWISVNGSLVEADVWCGALAHEGPGRSAVLLRTVPAGDATSAGAPATVGASAAAGTSTTARASATTGVSGASSSTVPGGGAGAATTSGPQEPQQRTYVLRDTVSDPSTPPRQVDCIGSVEDLGRIIIDPDPAAIRAGLVARIAEHWQARPVGPRIAYLTGDCEISPDDPLAPWVRWWHVREVLPMKLAHLRTYAREQGVTAVDIHCRGVEINPDQLRASLRLQRASAQRPHLRQTWLLTRVGEQAQGRVIVVEEP